MNARDICEQGVEAGVLRQRFEQFGKGTAKVLGRVYEETEAFERLDEEEKERYRRVMKEVVREYEEKAKGLEGTKMTFAVTQRLDTEKNKS